MYPRAIATSYHNVSSENYHFYSLENCCILHGRVFVTTGRMSRLMDVFVGVSLGSDHFILYGGGGGGRKMFSGLDICFMCDAILSF